MFMLTIIHPIIHNGGTHYIPYESGPQNPSWLLAIGIIGFFLAPTTYFIAQGTERITNRLGYHFLNATMLSVTFQFLACVNWVVSPNRLYTATTLFIFLGLLYLIGRSFVYVGEWANKKD